MNFVKIDNAKGNIISMSDIGNKSIAIASSDRTVRLVDYDKYLYKESKTIFDVDCEGINSMKVNDEHLYIAGSGKITVIDVKMFTVEFVCDYLNINIRAMCFFDRENNFMCGFA